MFGSILTFKSNLILLLLILSYGLKNFRTEEEQSTSSDAIFKIYLKMVQIPSILSMSINTSLVGLKCLKYHGLHSGKEEMTRLFPSCLIINLKMFELLSKKSTRISLKISPTNNTTALAQSTIIFCFQYLEKHFTSTSQLFKQVQV